MTHSYDTPESFSRAFSRFHGVSPSQARLGGAMLKSFSPIFVKMILDGGSMVSYRIEGFWQECIADGTTSALCMYIPEDDIFKSSIVGASFGKDTTDAEFPMQSVPAIMASLLQMA